MFLSPFCSGLILEGLSARQGCGTSCQLRLSCSSIPSPDPQHLPTSMPGHPAMVLAGICICRASLEQAKAPWACFPITQGYTLSCPVYYGHFYPCTESSKKSLGPSVA